MAVETVLKRLWLSPPLAFARLGPSSTPCGNYKWGPNDLRPGGSGKTTVVPAETLDLGSDGTISARRPDEGTFRDFKDDAGFRPLCPFFELYGEWTGAAAPGRITLDDLKSLGLTPAAVRWEVTLANLKPFHHTRHEGDRIDARIEVAGTDTDKKVILGQSPKGATRRLVPDPGIVLGWIQVAKLTPEFPECRLRFTPPGGLVYAPTNFNDRAKALVAAGSTRWKNADATPFQLHDDQLVLNPDAVWAQWAPREKAYETYRSHADHDFRTMPTRTYASDDTEQPKGHPNPSMGLVDDISDGFVRCRIGAFEAVARIVVSPPHFAPDRRPLVSIADGLKDRVDRADVYEPAYVGDGERDSRSPLTDEVRDLLERCAEVQGLMNLDGLNLRLQGKNREVARNRGVDPTSIERRLFPPIANMPSRPLPLTEVGRDRHRRLLAIEVLEDRVREDPLFIDRFVRAPVSGDPFFDARMPALMRGSDAHPMHLSRRQFELLKAWARGLRRKVRPLE